MNKSEYKILGVMSGTSLDGIDVAYLHFTKGDTWTYKIICGETIAYNSDWEYKLREAINWSALELEQLNIEYTKLLAEVINSFVAKHRLQTIDAVCSHGHTILHQPEKGVTLQIGNLKNLSELLQQKVVCDFRVQDVNLGGQGAPLVPIGDELLFSEYAYCLNLGGFSNISTQLNNKRIAYDICPVNIVLNHYVQKLGRPYDDGGQIAASGDVDTELLHELNSLEFYQLNFPKSLGLEWVKINIFPLIDGYNLSVSNTLRTFVEHCAIQICNQFQSKGKVLITGGGMYNSFLIKRIKVLSDNPIHMPDTNLIEFKEALIFGFLGVLKLREEINVLASVTGAEKNHSAGVVFNYK
jgi:anhydro-N-acetylmuramic acid kinase